jgi:PAS domain S-box-containing protein
LFGNILFNGLPTLPVRALTKFDPAVPSLGLLFASARSGGFARQYVAREDRRILVIGLALFSFVSLAAALIGIGIVGRYAMSNFQDALKTTLSSQTELFSASLSSAVVRSSDLVLLSGLDATARGSSTATLQREVERIVALAHFEQLSSLKVTDVHGRTLALSGTERFSGQFSLLFPSPLAARLYWQDGWHVLTTVPLADAGAVALVDMVLTSLNRQEMQMDAAWRTSETRVCGADAESIYCFPSRLQALPSHFPRAGNSVSAMKLALAGKQGVSPALDYRGKQVIAAFGPMGSASLGLVRKVDTNEFYKPLRRRLWYALFGIALLIVAGSALLYWRTRPLVSMLVHTRARLDAILDNVPAGVLTFDLSGMISSANSAALKMFGYQPEQLLGTPLDRLIPGALSRLTANGQAAQSDGVRSSGETLALEVVASEFILRNASTRIVIVQEIGARKHMEQVLRQRDESLAAAQGIAHIGSWERDIDSGAESWSDETFRIFNLTPGPNAPNYQSTQHLVHLDDRVRKERSLQAASEDNPFYDVSFRVVLPDGMTKVLHSLAKVEFDGAGRAVRARGTVQDITSKALADDMLRKREEEYRALVENSPDVVMRFDRRLCCTYVNPAIQHAPGLRDVIACGKMLDGGDGAPPFARLADAARRVLVTDLGETFEVSVAGMRGTSHFQVRLVPELIRGGEVRAVLAIARDITEIRNGEAMLRESEQRLAGIATNTPGMVFQCVSMPDDSFAFTFVSEGAVQLFGLMPSAIVANSALLIERIDAAERAGFYDSLSESARSMKMLNWEGRAHGLGDQQIWINCRATPRKVGAAMIWEGVVFSITASKCNEEALTASRQLLRELSAHMEGVREEERKNIAREVHDELGQALTAMRMDVSLLRLQFGEHSIALLERILSMRDAVDRTIGVVRQVTSALRPTALDLGLTAALEWQVEEFTRRSGIACVLHTGEVEVVLNDSHATVLFRIVQESLTNVLKHAAATSVEVTLRFEDGQVRLDVCDNGIGFTTQAPRKPGKFGLMGMRERVLMLGGTVAFQSANGTGTCVLVRLPIHTEKNEPVLNQDD